MRIGYLYEDRDGYLKYVKVSKEWMPSAMPHEGRLPATGGGLTIS
jgi:hypothetical protein